MPVILALERLRQEDYFEFEASYTGVRSCLAPTPPQSGKTLIIPVCWRVENCMEAVMA